MNDGQWLDTPGFNGSHAPFKKWQPPGCMLHQYSASDISTCMNGRKVVLAGDSTTRQVFWSIARKLNSTAARQAESSARRHADQSFRSQGIELEFIWDPFLNNSRTEEILAKHMDSQLLTRKDPRQSPALILLGAGAWFARWLGSEDSLAQYASAISNVTTYRHHDVGILEAIRALQGSELGDQIFLAPVPTPIYEQPDGPRKETIQQAEIEQMNDLLRDMGANSNVIWSYEALTKDQPQATEFAGFHVRESVADVKADIILNLRCNAELDLKRRFPFNWTCCSDMSRQIAYNSAFFYLQDSRRLPRLSAFYSAMKRTRPRRPAQPGLSSSAT